MLKRTTLLMSLSLSILLVCCSDDKNENVQVANLEFTEENLEGDWKRIAQFKGQPNDSLGVLMPLEDLFAQFESCRKDDIVRYVKGNGQEENRYFWGIGEIACHSQIAKTFGEIGTWTLEESGKLSHVNSDTSEYHIVVALNAQQLLIRSESDENETDGITFEFTEYERLK